MKTFGELYGGEPEVCASAPGRVNLLGEHTDYNEGYVLPTAIPQRTRVCVRRAAGNRTSIYSADLDRSTQFSAGQPPADPFAAYVYGCMRMVQVHYGQFPALDIHIASDVPLEVGLSSSAALEVATLRALRALLELDLDDVRLAELAQRAEIEDAGVNCGILDQMASSLLEVGAMLFLDTRTFERRLLPLPDDAEIVVLDSGIARTLAGSKYNERRAECEHAARMLGLATLRDVRDPHAIEQLEEPFRRRTRHVVSENERVLHAARGIDAKRFGELMSDSHASLRDDYEVSLPALDRLVALLQADPCVYGAKLTGAGFGGACVALCIRGEAGRVAARALAAYSREGHSGALLVPQHR